MGTISTSDMVDWIRTINEETLDEVMLALQARHEALLEERACEASVGSAVTLYNVTPECLNGMDGVIVEADEDEGTVSVLLSASSTGRLRFTGREHFRVGMAEQYLLHDVWAECCYKDESLVAVAG